MTFAEVQELAVTMDLRFLDSPSNLGASMVEEVKTQRTAPAVDRVVSILNFFAQHPQQAFTLSQVVKATKLPRATCHLLLVSLMGHSYLFRNLDRSYVLGPALLAISNKARDGFSSLDVARQEMRLLSDELDVVVCAQFREGGDVVTSEYTVSISHLAGALPGASQTSLHPWGAIFLAPLRDAEVEAELSMAEPPLTEPEKEDERRQIRFAREHGFVFAVHRMNSERALRGANPATGDFVYELRPDLSYRLQFLLAPVMDEIGQASFLLALSGFQGEYSGEEVRAISARVLAACKRITSFVVGKRPMPSGDPRGT